MVEPTPFEKFWSKMGSSSPSFGVNIKLPPHGFLYLVEERPFFKNLAGQFSMVLIPKPELRADTGGFPC